MSIENANEINVVFPKYLFMKKDKFIEIYKKLNYERISRIIILIKKTEILLRKNTLGNHFFLIYLLSIHLFY